MNNIEGRIKIEMSPNPKGGLSVEIQSNRPVHASQIMIGKTPEQVLDLLPLMFSVCGIAQARGSLKAIMQQLDIPTSQAHEKAREMLVIAETAREHLFRIFMDWPELFNIPRNNQLFPFITSLIKRMSEALFKSAKAFKLDSELQLDRPQLNQLIDEIKQQLSSHVFQCPVDEWLTLKGIEEMTLWATGNKGIAAMSIQTILNNNWQVQGYLLSSALPELDVEKLTERFHHSSVKHFIEQPDWDGQLYETTPLSRQKSHPMIQSLQNSHGNTLITRWVARLVDLATIPQQLRRILHEINGSTDDTFKPTAAHGIAQIEAARGKLIHHVEIEHDQITQYQILAPTEWNFHPKGLIQQSLSHIRSSDKKEIEHIARLLINAIDPCVGYDLRVH